LSGLGMTEDDCNNLRRLLSIFFFGQIVGLPSLHAMMQRFGLKSNNEQVKYKKICKKLTNSNLHKLFEYIFMEEAEQVLARYNGKHHSKRSRELLTAVLDDSVFKQWVNQQDAKVAYEDCYGRFFSGQVGHVVYGLQVVVFGLVADGVFYPLFFECVKKEEPKQDDKGKKTKEKGKKTIEVAKRLIRKWACFTKDMGGKGIDVPTINFSCDSGYSDVSFSEECALSGLTYISVPKLNHKIEYGDSETNLSDWINNVYTDLEKKHEEKEIGLKEEDKTIFNHRFSAFYKCQNRYVTFLAFRLNGSKKVSIIYTTDKNIKAMTLRRHWFQRTYIEQFFKILKHYMKIQRSITTTKHDFDFKLLYQSFVALNIQLLVKYMKRKIPNPKNKGFGYIRQFMQSDSEVLDLLRGLLTVK
jgi:hypothetical protein